MEGRRGRKMKKVQMRKAVYVYKRMASYHYFSSFYSLTYVRYNLQQQVSATHIIMFVKA